MAQLIIERLLTLDAPGLDELVRESAASGYRFLQRLVAEWSSGANRFDREGEALFGALHEGRLVGLCGLNRDPFASAGRAGRVRHLYVLGQMRRSGAGSGLLAHVVEHARGRWDELHLRAADESAARFFEARGFVRTSLVETCTHVLQIRPSPR